MKTCYVYILTNKPNGVLFVGITSDLENRIFQHKKKLVEGVSKEYNLTNLVWFEEIETIQKAIEYYEKKLKGLSREKKINLITSKNSDWKDLAKDWYK